MSKFVKVPDVAIICDPVTGDPTGESFPFAKTVKIVSIVAQQAGVEPLMLMEIRTRFSESKPGDIIELTDEEHTSVLPHFKNPRGANPALIFSIEEHLRAVVDAPSKRPLDG